MFTSTPLKQIPLYQFHGLMGEFIYFDSPATASETYANTKLLNRKLKLLYIIYVVKVKIVRLSMALKCILF